MAAYRHIGGGGHNGGDESSCMRGLFMRLQSGWLLFVGYALWRCGLWAAWLWGYATVGWGYII